MHLDVFLLPNLAVALDNHKHYHPPKLCAPQNVERDHRACCLLISFIPLADAFKDQATFSRHRKSKRSTLAMCTIMLLVARADDKREQAVQRQSGKQRRLVLLQRYVTG
jgi:hypothetical protein